MPILCLLLLFSPRPVFWRVVLAEVGCWRVRLKTGRTVLKLWQCCRQLLERLSISCPLFFSDNCLRYMKVILQQLCFPYMTQSLHPLDLHWSLDSPRNLVFWAKRCRGWALLEPSHIESRRLRVILRATCLLLPRSLEPPWRCFSSDCSVPPFIPYV